MKYRIQFKPYKRKFIRPVRLGKNFYDEREGAVIFLSNESGKSGFGEIAPLPGFATETLEEALRFCGSLDGEIDDSIIEEIPDSLPCVNFAFECAVEMVHETEAEKGNTGQKPIVTTALLPTGPDVMESLNRLVEEGFSRFKWKIGVEDFRFEEKMFHLIAASLPTKGRLRLDANGCLDESRAKRWLELLEGCKFVEFLEQPLAIERFDRMLELAENHSTAIALDESAAGLSSLKRLVNDDWKGPLVVKTAIIGSPKAFLDWSATCPNPLVFSSSFETAVGFQAGLKLASKAGNSKFAPGFGTNRFFHEDGLSLHGYGPELNPDLLSVDDFLQLWDRMEHCPKPVSRKKSADNILLLCERDAIKFQQFFFEALEGNDNQIFLANPDWGISRWEEVLELLKPDEIIGSIPHELLPPTKQTGARLERLSGEGQGPLIMIPTGGSTGGLRFAVHTKETLTSAVAAFVAGFGITPVNSFCILPLHHVSGLMQLFRARQTGGKVVFGSGKNLFNGCFPNFDPSEFMISVVSLQLRRLLKIPECAEWLRKFKMVLLGGGKADDELLETARTEGIRLAPSYGLTETAAVTVALTPEEFLSGAKGSGRALPGTQISVRDKGGNTLPPGQTGRIHIRSNALCRGYIPSIPWTCKSENEIATGDQGFFDSKGSLHVTGRLDRIIVTGGEKVDPREVENAILKTGLATDAFVFGVSDLEWGQKVAALIVPLKSETNFEEIKSSLSNILGPSQIPKIWKIIPRIPRNSLGKIDMEEAETVFHTG